MKYLCIETTGIQGFIALFSDGKKEKELIWSSERHSEKLIQNILPFFNKAQTLDIKFIAVNQGPGRFTGIRIGVNFSKVLAYYLSCPIYPCCSLRIMSHSYLKKQDKPVLCLMEAFGEKFYLAIYQKINQKVQTLLKPVALSKNQIENYIQQPMLCIGDVYEKKKFLFSKKTQEFLQFHQSKEISSLEFSSTVLAEWKEEDLQNWSEVEPLYLRVPGVLKKRNDTKESNV